MRKPGSEDPYPPDGRAFAPVPIFTRMTSTHKRFCLVLIVAAAGLVAGCAGSTVDAENAADTIQKQYPSKSGGLALTSISCDSGDAEVDATFSCSGVNDAGLTLDIEATVTEVNEDSGDLNFSWSLVSSTSDGTVYAEAATANLKQQGFAITSIDCPEIKVEKGTVTDCEATLNDGSTQSATITLTDDAGGFDVETSPDAP